MTITATNLTGRRFTARGLTGRSLSGFSFRDLFNGYDGAWYEPSANTQFTTSAGSTLAGAGDPVGRFEDSSGSGHHATQPTSGSRPIKAREPVGGVRVISTSTWTTANAPATIEETSEVPPPIGSSVFLLSNASGVGWGQAGAVSSAFASLTPDNGYIGITLVLPKTATTVTVSARNNNTGGETHATFPLTQGQWTPVYASRVIGANGQLGFSIGGADGDFYAVRPSVEDGSVFSGYQFRANAFDITEFGVPSVSFTRFDGVDDWLDTGVERMGNTGLFCGPGERFFVAFAARRTAAAGSWGTIISRASGNTADRTFHVAIDDNGAVRLVVRGASATAIPGTMGEWVVGLLNWDGGQLTALFNSTTQTLNIGTATEQATNIIVGAISGGSTDRFNGDISTLIIRDYDLTPAQQAAVMQNLADQVGVTL